MTEVTVSVDIGGTFTDIALESAGVLTTGKVLTDQANPENAIIEVILDTAARAGAPLGKISKIIHGTTLVANALIERRGAKTAFITTSGFRDVIEMRSENRFEQYDLNLQLPTPLVPRQFRFTAAERVAADGSVLLSLSAAETGRLVDCVAAGKFESVAIGFLHSFANDTHETRMADALNEALPGLPVSLSSAVSPQMRELPRFNTVIANAFVQPKVATYLRNLVDRLNDFEISAPLFMFHSGGGLIGIETAIEQPIRLIESGPAGGAVFASGFARSHGIKNALSFDMGGTTAKICLIEGGAPKTAATIEAARTYRFKKGSGMALSTPVVEMIEIGAGGGSVSSRDPLGRIRVGPQSAGSDPGPACYGRGGRSPTVTDADLLLGRLDPELFAGGTIPLDPDLARQAMRGAFNADDTLTDLSFAVTETVDENMANAARVHAVENGRDIERYSLVAFGGCAPLHGCRLCEKLGIDTMIVPPGAGVGSAIGFLKAPFSYEATRGLFMRLDAFDRGAVNAVLEDMEGDARRFVGRAAAGLELRTRLTAYMRYRGQGWEIPVPLSFARVDDTSPADLRIAFEIEYANLFGRTVAGLCAEITNWSLAVFTNSPPIGTDVPPETETPVQATRHRVYFDAVLRRQVDAAEVPRSRMTPGSSVEGPAIVTEDETSTIVTSSFRAVGRRDGSLLVIRKRT